MTSKIDQRQWHFFNEVKPAEPALVSACLLGIPRRWYGRSRQGGRPSRRAGLTEQRRTCQRSPPRRPYPRQRHGKQANQEPENRGALDARLATHPLAGYNESVYTLRRWSRSSAAAS
jgi:hypothetical protein